MKTTNNTLNEMNNEDEKDNVINKFNSLEKKNDDEYGKDGRDNKLYNLNEEFNERDFDYEFNNEFDNEFDIDGAADVEFDDEDMPKFEPPFYNHPPPYLPETRSLGSLLKLSQQFDRRRSLIETRTTSNLSRYNTLPSIQLSEDSISTSIQIENQLSPTLSPNFNTNLSSNFDSNLSSSLHLNPNTILSRRLRRQVSASNINDVLLEPNSFIKQRKSFLKDNYNMKSFETSTNNENDNKNDKFNDQNKINKNFNGKIKTAINSNFNSLSYEKNSSLDTENNNENINTNNKDDQLCIINDISPTISNGSPVSQYFLNPYATSPSPSPKYLNKKLNHSSYGINNNSGSPTMFTSDSDSEIPLGDKLAKQSDATVGGLAAPPETEYKGFAVYLGSILVLILYILWAFTPESVLNYFNIYYYPSRWWALVIPSFLVIFILYIYIALLSYNCEHLTRPFSNIETIVDEAANITHDPQYIFKLSDGVWDLPLETVNKVLYSRRPIS